MNFIVGICEIRWWNLVLIVLSATAEVEEDEGEIERDGEMVE